HAVGNNFRVTETEVTIPTSEGSLAAVLTQPRGKPATGLVVMVHGDAAVDATQGGFYAPWFEAAADAGFATLSWSKPGVGESTGNWLDQSMSDRASEVGTALDWAKRQRDIPTERIVLWGASQAGWVLPKVVAARDDIDGVVAVGTAINWLTQGRFHLLAELDAADATPEERAAALAESDAVRALLERGAEHSEYLAESTEDEPMSAERWGFVRRNVSADATADLRASAAREVPILLLAGSQDRNVDMRETERVYREIFGDALTVARVESRHSMARPTVEDSDLVGAITAVFWPRALLAPGVLDAAESFLSGVG
ncbi:alpha/beta hydrolase family protein, partial [Leucobacter sp. M11]|uniref:alpha/beta hydrolase family protein n=1 Tax=Leucobacter sp. M11 TaxID=2993565 RepID=UPI002D7F2E78